MQKYSQLLVLGLRLEFAKSSSFFTRNPSCDSIMQCTHIVDWLYSCTVQWSITRSTTLVYNMNEKTTARWCWRAIMVFYTSSVIDHSYLPWYLLQHGRVCTCMVGLYHILYPGMPTIPNILSIASRLNHLANQG